MITIEVFPEKKKAGDGEHYKFRIKRPNGEIIYPLKGRDDIRDAVQDVKYLLENLHDYRIVRLDIDGNLISDITAHI